MSYPNDDATGMQLLGARYYLPKLGRFLTPDPIGHAGGLNLYAYCEDSPLERVDPDGKFPLNAFTGFAREYAPFLRKYRSADEAAITAGNWAFARGSGKFELGGWIYANATNTVFRLTLPRRSREGSEANVHPGMEPFNAKAIWHIHPFRSGLPYPGRSRWKTGNPLMFSNNLEEDGSHSGDIPLFNRNRVNGYVTTFGLTLRYNRKAGTTELIDSPFRYLP